MAQARSFSLGGSSRTGLLLAAILAAVTGVLVFVVLQGNDSGDTVKQIGTGETTVVTAKENIDAREEITMGMLELTRVPAGVALEGVFSDRNLVVGRIARIPIYKGEQLVQDKLASEKKDLGLAFVVPDGMRGIAVEVNKVVGAGGLLRPGDRVDVIGVVDVKYKDLNTDREYTETRSFTMAQNIEVLAVEDKLVNTVPQDASSASTSGDGGSSGGGGTPTDQPKPDPDAKVVTLSLTPQEAQDLLLADEKGTIRLAARAAGDDEILDLGNSNYLSLADPAFAKLIQDILQQPKR